jgi:hypothetical protein
MQKIQMVARLGAQILWGTLHHHPALLQYHQPVCPLDHPWTVADQERGHTLTVGEKPVKYLSFAERV